MFSAKPQGSTRAGSPARLPIGNDGAEAGILGRRAGGSAVEGLIDLGGDAGAAGGEQHVHRAEDLADFGLHEAAQAHGLQIVLGGKFEAGFQAGDLRLVGQFIDFAAGDQRFENRTHFAVEDGGKGRAVGEVRQLGFHELHAGRLEHRDGGIEGGAGGGFGPLGEIGRARSRRGDPSWGGRIGACSRSSCRRSRDPCESPPAMAWRIRPQSSAERRRVRACPGSRKAPWRRSGSPGRRWGAGR